MIDQSFEQRIAAAVAAYADLAPTDVDAVTMTRLAVAGSRRIGPVWFGSVPTGRGLVVAVALLALLVTMLAGAFVAGRYLIDRPVLAERALIEPFVGLPPEGAAPSTPENGELVLSFGGRVHSLGLDFHRMWLYADGRLIWKSNLEGGVGWRIWAERFGGHEPTTAVIEQRVTAEGVDLMRSRAMAAAGLRDIEPIGTNSDGITWLRPGVLWGGLVLQDGERRVETGWTDSELPGLLAVPTSWPPAPAWEDKRIGAYVPSQYAVCVEDFAQPKLTPLERSGLIDMLPRQARQLIRSRALGPGPIDSSVADPRCLHQLTTDDARAIMAILDDSLIVTREGSTPPHDPLRYRIDVGPIGYQVMVELLPVLPNGEVVCNCG